MDSIFVRIAAPHFSRQKTMLSKNFGTCKYYSAPSICQID